MAKKRSINMSNSAVKSSKPPEFTPKPAGKSRTKTRKPKYLSLNLQLSSKEPEMTLKQQLDLFPLHPESKFDPIDSDQVSDDDVAFLFETATDTSTSLRGILDLDSAASTAAAGSEEAPGEGDHQKLVRKAMKRKERDASDDRWVTYREVVEEVSSCSYGGGGESPEKRGLVGLKLNYEHVLNAWSDKGPLYVRGETPQTVPDLLNDTNGMMESEWGNLWKVPEIEKGKVKMEKREASVLRYKEKRQSRLFAKRIRYQVRKLNAEKRPRLKGRFVKRNDED